MNEDYKSVIVQARKSGLLKGPQLLLMLLDNKSREGWRITDFCDATGLSPTNINMAKENMLKDKLIEEHYPHRDGRSVRIYLTEKGREAAGVLWDAMAALINIEKSWWEEAPPPPPDL